MDEGPMTIYYILTALVLIILAVPMIKGKVPPNHWYGFRVRRTMKDPQVWYPANAYAGKLLLVYGLAIIIAALALPELMAGFSPETLDWAMTAVLLGGILIVVLFCWRFLRTL